RDLLREGDKKKKKKKTKNKKQKKNAARRRGQSAGEDNGEGVVARAGAGAGAPGLARAPRRACRRRAVGRARPSPEAAADARGGQVAGPRGKPPPAGSARLRGYPLD